MAHPKLKSLPMVFLTPPGGEEKRFRHDLGVAYIQAYLDEHGIETAQYCSGLGPSLREVIDWIRAHDPRILGIKCYDTNYYYAKLIAEAAKQASRGLLVVFGGPSATFSSDFIMGDCSAVDACVIHEGEQTCLELVQTPAANWSRVAGLVLRTDGTTIATPARPQVRGGPRRGELDRLPSPLLRGFMPPRPRFGLLTSRGCSYKCTYCNFSAMGQYVVRYHSPERVLEEVLRVGDYARSLDGRRVYLEFYDDALTLNVKRAKEIFGTIAEHRQPIDLFCHTRVDSLDDELLAAMSGAGVISINFGVESGVGEVLKTIGKARPSTKLMAHEGLEPEIAFLENIKGAIARTKRHGIKPSVSIITGLPGETLADAQRTLALIAELDVYEYTHNVLRVFAGTELARTHARYGLSVERSAFGLPTITRSSFDSRMVAPLRNATIHKYDLRLVAGFASLFTGDYQSAGQMDPMAILFETPSGTEEGLRAFRELLEQHPLPCGTALYVATPLDGSMAEVNTGDGLLRNEGAARVVQGSLQRYLAGARAFSRDINLLARNTGDEPAGWLWYPDLTSVDLLKRFEHRVTVQPLATFMSTPTEQRLRRGDISIVSVDTPDDVDLLRHVHTHEEAYGAFAAACGQGHAILADRCRWGRAECPQLRAGGVPRRLFVGNDGRATLCASHRANPAGAMGLATGTAEALRDGLDGLQRQWEEEKAARGCARCAIRERCAKCPNPHPLDAQAYCRAMLAAAAAAGAGHR